MRGKGFLDRMELIDPAYVEAAGEVKRKNKISPLVKWGSMAACVCFVTAGTVLMWGAWNTTEPSVYAEETSAAHETQWEEKGAETYAEELETSVSETIGRDSFVAETEDMVEITIDPYFEDPISGVFQGITSREQEILSGKPMISGFGVNSYVDGLKVENGKAVFSSALLSAMESYGDTVNYRVLVELFCDGEPILSGGELALKEANRLSALGYIVAMENYAETETVGEISTAKATYYFTLHITYEQLVNFTAESELGYSIMLYDEYFDMPLAFYAPNFNGTFESVQPRKTEFELA